MNQPLPLTDAALGARATPRARAFYFGAPGAECLGWLHRPAAGRARDLGVVLCNPLGYDLMPAHRTYRFLATRLAAEGYTVLRFEYPSTGDSAGLVDDPDRVAAWLASVAEACGEARRLGGVARLVLFGLRSGGTLGAAAVARLGIPGVVGFAAWAPFASGGLMLRELRALASLKAHPEPAPPAACQTDLPAAAAAATGAPAPPTGLARADGGMHVAGFGFSAQTVADLEGLVLNKLPAPAPRCLLLQRDDLPADPRLARHWTAQGAEVDTQAASGYAAMMLDAFESHLPVAAIDAVVGWIRALPSAPLGALPADDAAPMVAEALLSSRGAGHVPDVRERPVRFGEDAGLVGVLCTPLGIPQHGTAVLFPTVGANHHIGVNRLHVELARELAARGYASLRMDVDGAGESGIVAERERFWEYKTDTYLDVLQGVDWLTEQPCIGQCVLWGICSGAYMAYHAAQFDPRVAGAWLFNLQLFHWHDREVAENMARTQAKSLGFYGKSALKPETWRRLLTGDVRMRVIVRGLRARVSKRVRGRVSLVRAQWLASASSPLKDVTQLAERGCRVSFVCTPEDVGLHEIKTHLGARAAQATRLPGVEYVEVGLETAADHIFTSLASQRWVKDWTLARMQEFFP